MDSLQAVRDAHEAALRLPQIASDRSPAQNAVHAVRAWPYLTAAAAAAVTRFESPDAGRTLERIAITGRATHVPAENALWPGLGPIDPMAHRLVTHLQQISQRDTDSLSAEDRAEAARLIISSVWVIAEHTRRAIDRYADELLDVGDKGAQLRAQVLTAGRHVHAGSHVAVTSLRAPRPQDDTAVGVSQALATWDIEAHRALLGSRATLTLHAVAELEVQTVHRLRIAMQYAGGEVQQIDATDLRPVLDALDETRTRWEAVAGITAEFGTNFEPLPRQLLEAGRNLGRRLGQEVHSPATEDHQRQLLAVHHSHLGSLVSIASTAADLARDGGLMAPSGAVEAAIRARNPSYPVYNPPGRSVRLPHVAREELFEALDATSSAAIRALQSSSPLDTVYRSPAAAASTLPASRRVPVPALPPLIVDSGPAR